LRGRLAVRLEVYAREVELTMTNGRRWITLYVLCVGMLMIVLYVTVVNVALPSTNRRDGTSRR